MVRILGISSTKVNIGFLDSLPLRHKQSLLAIGQKDHVLIQFFLMISPSTGLVGNVNQKST